MSPLVYSVGQRVRHADFGEGTVRSIGANGALLKVFFDAIGSAEPVHSSSLTALSPPGRQPGSPAEPPKGPAHGPAPAPDLHRLTVECLRQGLPPPGKLTSWTVGHAKARKTIDAAIASAARGKGSVLFARAGYGQGKSHLGRLGRELAREQGLASFHVELDGKGLSLGTDSRVVASLFASARLPDSEQDQEHLVPGLATILKRAAHMATHGVPPALAYFAPFLKNPSRWAESEEVIEVLEEYLSGYRNRTDSAAYLLRLFGVRMTLEPLKLDWGRTEDRLRARAQQLERLVRLAMLAGAKGAFVVIDELDHDFQSDVHRKNAMLGELGRITTGNPIVLMLLARELEMTDATGATELELGDFAEEELELLVNKAIDAFAAAHPSPALTRGRNELFAALLRKFRKEYQGIGWGPRFFVRATVECCEATRSCRLDSLAQVDV